ncbi:MAG: molybdate ABC transporter substrate-binding protein [Micromonosporaceae bacterium]|nr:molybdate ABC transporter substrate-binding protein [Micromonosporaceae bacterium]
MGSSRATGPPAGLVATALVVALAVAGCGGSADADPPEEGVGGTVTIFAAASLTEPFGRLGEDFEAAYPGATVVLNFAGSATLAQQINEGAPVDVFAAADPTSMQLVADGGGTGVSPATFARNQLVIAVGPGNPLGIAGLADLPGLTVALCAEQVPCGRAAQRALAAAGVALTPATLERDVKAALAKVELGEVDAALVYRTDVRASEQVDGVEFPESAEAVNDYPISVLDDAPNPTAAAAFVELVLSEAGQAVLADAGFARPS